MKKRKAKKIRVQELANGPLKTQTEGTKKGKRGYTRKNKDWKQDQ
jgi:hypothetical protein